MWTDTTRAKCVRADLASPGGLTDTEGNLVHAVIHPADVQDRDGAPIVLAEIVQRHPWLRHVFADGG